MNEVFGSAGAGFMIFLLFMLVIALLVVVFNMNVRMNRLQRRYNLFMKGSDGQSVEKAMSSRLRELGKLRSGQERSREDLADLQHQYNTMLCKYGIVKYDAFEDVGGKMSFALAMLDQTNTGFVLNAIHSRDNCYLYLKDVVKGTSYIMLSDEEVEALRRASRFGEAEAAAAISRRKRHDEERARKEAAEEARAEQKLAAQAVQRRKRAETPEEAELRMLEEIIANAENKSAGKPAQEAEGTAQRSEGTARRQPAAKASEARTSEARPARQETVQPVRRAPAAEQPQASIQEVNARIRETVQEIDGRIQPAAQEQRAEAAGPAIEPAAAAAGPAGEPAAAGRMPREDSDPAVSARRAAAARRIDDGMPELTE